MHILGSFFRFLGMSNTFCVFHMCVWDVLL